MGRRARRPPRSCSSTGSRRPPRTGTSRPRGRWRARSPAPATSSSPMTGSGTPTATGTRSRGAATCSPPFLDSPYGEIADIGAMYAENDAYIAMIGSSIPVLLTSGEEDSTDPPSSADADYAYYQAHCGCDVTQLLLPDTAHLFMVHT